MDIGGAVTGECWCVVGKNFIVKLYLRKIFLYIFCVRKYFYKNIKNIKNVKRCRDGMPKSMQTR